MTMRTRIESRLADTLAPQRLRIDDESHRHKGGAGAESHWNLIIVSEAFAGKNRVQRHRQVHEALAQELSEGIHALTFKALTPAEWEAAGGEVENPAPPCRGGSKHRQA